MVTAHRRCFRCGAPLKVTRKRGVKPKYCKQCFKIRRIEISAKSRRKKNGIIKTIINTMPRTEDYPTKIDEFGKPHIDDSHADWDVFPTPYGYIEILGTVTENKISKRIYHLQKRDEELRKHLKRKRNNELNGNNNDR